MNLEKKFKAMNSNNCNNSKMLPLAEHSTFQKNKESLLYVAARVLPVHTEQYTTALKKDSLVEPLTEHWIYESDVGLKAKTEKELHRRKVALDTAKTARDDAEKDMNLFAVDELRPTRLALEEAEENEKRCKAAMEMKEQSYAKEWEELKKNFEENKNKGMTEVTKKFHNARDDVDEKTIEMNEKVDKGKFFRMYSHCNHLHCIF